MKVDELIFEIKNPFHLRTEEAKQKIVGPEPKHEADADAAVWSSQASVTDAKAKAPAMPDSEFQEFQESVENRLTERKKEGKDGDEMTQEQFTQFVLAGTGSEDEAAAAVKKWADAVWQSCADQKQARKDGMERNRKNMLLLAEIKRRDTKRKKDLKVAQSVTDEVFNDPDFRSNRDRDVNARLISRMNQYWYEIVRRCEGRWCVVQVRRRTRQSSTV